MNKFYTENSSIEIPKRSTKFSAGYDFCSPDRYVIAPHSKILIDSGVTVKLDEDKVLMLYIRSSYAFKHDIKLVNSTGIIDSDYYPNNIKCKLINDSDEPFVIEKGDHYMQGIIMKYFTVDDEDTSTIATRDGGIGSTGK